MNEESASITAQNDCTSQETTQRMEIEQQEDVQPSTIEQQEDVQPSTIEQQEDVQSSTIEQQEDVQPSTIEQQEDVQPKKREKSGKTKAKPKSKPSKDAQPIVCVKDVSVIFNIANEKIQSLKEYFIKMTKRELMFRKFVAVDNISFQVNKGDVFGLVGTNGSGKSTLLKVVAGVLEPSTGTCTVNGTISPLIELGAGFDMELTARENIYLNGALLGLSKKFIDEQIDEIIDFAELHDFMEMPLKNYSSGMVARIAFAIATTTEPDLLIVDEVLSVGDFLFQEKCEKRITGMIKHGTTVLIVSHNIKQIERLCNRALWIEKSKMQMIGKAKEVCKAYKHFEGSE